MMQTHETTMGLFKHIRDYFDNPEVLQHEAAKIFLMVSTAFLFFSLYMLFQLSIVSEDLNSFQENTSTLSGSVNTEQFNDTIDALEDVQSGAISDYMSQAANVLETFQASKNSLKSANTKVGSLLQLLRWLFLISLLGEVAGVTLLYL